MLLGTGGGGKIGSTAILHSQQGTSCATELNLLNRVLHHRGDQPRNVGRRELQTRVRVDLNQPRVHVLVNHEVVSKYFPGVLAPTRVHLRRNRLHRVLHQLLELGQHRLHEVALNAHRVEVLLEIGVRKLPQTITH